VESVEKPSHVREEFVEDVEKSSPYVKELSPYMKKSSHVREESVAVLSVFRRDGFGSKSVREESHQVAVSSKSVVTGSIDVRFEPRA